MLSVKCRCSCDNADEVRMLSVSVKVVLDDITNPPYRDLSQRVEGESERRNRERTNADDQRADG